MRSESYFKDFQTLVKKALPRYFGSGAVFSHPAPKTDGGENPFKGRYFLYYWGPAVISAVLIVVTLYLVSNRDSSVPAGLFPREKTEFLAAGLLDQKLAKLEERIKTDPNDIQALFEAGFFKYQKGPQNYIDAISDLETARTRGFADIRIFYYLGRMYQAVGLYDFALEEYQRFLNNRPDDLEVGLLTAKLLFSSGKYQLAAKAYEELGVRHPKNISVLENLALSRWKNGQDPKPALDIMSRLGAEAVFRAGYVSGRIDYDNKDYSAAAQKFELAAADLPKYPEFSDRAVLYQMLSDSYIKLKSDTQAIAALNELLKVSPANAEARSLLARLTKARNKTKSPAKNKK